MVELVRIVSSWRRLRRAVHGLSEVPLPEYDVVATLPRLGCADRSAHVDQCPRHSDGGASRDGLGDFHFHPGDDDDHPRSPPLAPQSVHALGASASGDLQSLWRGLGPGAVALLGIRTALDRGRGGRRPATILSAGARAGGAALDCSLFSANVRRPRLGRQLGAVAYRILLRRRRDDRRLIQRTGRGSARG